MPDAVSIFGARAHDYVPDVLGPENRRVRFRCWFRGWHDRKRRGGAAHSRTRSGCWCGGHDQMPVLAWTSGELGREKRWVPIPTLVSRWRDRKRRGGAAHSRTRSGCWCGGHDQMPVLVWTSGELGREKRRGPIPVLVSRVA